MGPALFIPLFSMTNQEGGPDGLDLRGNRGFRKCGGCSFLSIGWLSFVVKRLIPNEPPGWFDLTYGGTLSILKSRNKIKEAVS